MVKALRILYGCQNSTGNTSQQCWIDMHVLRAFTLRTAVAILVRQITQHVPELDLAQDVSNASILPEQIEYKACFTSISRSQKLYELSVNLLFRFQAPDLLS